MSTTPFSVLVTAPQLAPEARAALEAGGATLRFMAPPVDEAALVQALQAQPAHPVQALILRGSPPITSRVLDAAPALRLVAKNGAGVDSVDIAACTRRGVGVAVAAGGNADAVAEHTLALMLHLVRGLGLLDARVRTGGWADSAHQGRDFRGSVVGIVGWGRIGQRTAEMAAALGAKVRVWRPSGGSEAGGFALAGSLEELLPQLDILSLHCPLNERTRGLIGARELALLKPHALLVNTARGPVVDEAALVAALRSGHLAGAGLDTFHHEPLPAGHALLSLPQVCLTPHVAGVTRNAALRVALMTADNVLDYLAGRPLPTGHLLNPN